MMRVLSHRLAMDSDPEGIINEINEKRPCVQP